ncbi:hypothetical protein [Cellulomonas sp. KRMCY2]|uniref:hypothetical protein n=1 Tax=Cellulomonas sp. KRMCY2 TaxID=1304865 RepID=UPI00045E6D91|nr:hypothetical protein [Cellulomonas sp. KRMCY2]
MTPDEVAQAYERARYEQLRGQTWTDLREGERAARIEVARKALDDSGIAAVIDDLGARAARADELAGLLAQRDAEIARRNTEHDAELTRLETRLADLSAQLDDVRTESVRAHTEADRARGVVAAIQAALTSDDGAAPIKRPDQAQVADRAEACTTSPAAPSSGKGLFGRRPRTDAALA